MSKLEFLDQLALRLSRFPGLGFLHSYTIMIRQRKTNFEQQIGDYEGMVDNARDIGGDVRGAASSKRRGKRKRSPNSDTL